MSDIPNDAAQVAAEIKRKGTLKMATLAVQNILLARQKEEGRTNLRDVASELMLPFSSLLLILAVTYVGEPMIKAAAFLLPLSALMYYIYRRIGVISTFDSRQAFITWRLLLASFLFGGTFALFGTYVLAYIATRTLH